MKRAILPLSIILVVALAGCAGAPAPEPAAEPASSGSELKPDTGAGATVDITASANSSRGVASLNKVSVKGKVLDKSTKKGLPDRKLIIILLREEPDPQRKGAKVWVQKAEKETTSDRLGEFQVTLTNKDNPKADDNYRVRIVDDETDAYIVIPVN
jgi:hypothetical protein